MRWWAEQVLRWRLLFAAIVVAAIALSAWKVPETRLDMGISSLIGGHPGGRARLAKDAEQLPSPPPARFFCVLSWPKEIGKTELAWLAEICREIERDERVSKVLSLANVPVLQGGSLLPRPFPATVGDRPIRAVVAEHPLLQRRLLSEDGRSAVLVITPQLDRTTTRIAIIEWLKELLPQRKQAAVDIQFVSSAIADKARKGYMAEDLTRIVGLELLIFSILLPLLFRSARGVLLPLLTVICAVLFNLGLLTWCGGKISVIEIAIPGLIVMIGLSDAVHMLHRYEEARQEGADKRTAILQMTIRVGSACLITSLTTAIAFLSLLITDHEAIRVFAWKAAFAVMLTFVATIVVIPLGLSFLPTGRPTVPRVPGVGALRYGKGWLTATALVVSMGLAAFGASGIVVEAKWLEELPDHDPIKGHVAFLEEQFRGAITLDAGISGDLRDPAVFAAMERFEARMRKRPEVLGYDSPTQWVRAANGNPPKMTAEQVTRGMQLLTLLPKSVFPDHLLRRDFSSARIMFNVRNLSSREYLQLRDELVVAAEATAPGLNIWPTGFGLMAYEAGQMVAETLVESLLLSLLAITLLIMVLYRSFRLGLISIVPNAVPILVALGVNGFLDIPLRIGIVMIYSLGLGLAVDDSVHLITRWRQERRANPAADPRRVVLRSLRSSGTALVVTSVVLVLGSLCFLIANFRSAYDVGVLLSTIVVTALVLDLLVLPHLLERCEVK